MRAMKQQRVRKGAVAVEFAIVAPVLLAIMFGMIQYGKAFEMQNQLQVAAREGVQEPVEDPAASNDREPHPEQAREGRPGDSLEGARDESA